MEIVLSLVTFHLCQKFLNQFFVLSVGEKSFQNGDLSTHPWGGRGLFEVTAEKRNLKVCTSCFNFKPKLYLIAGKFNQLANIEALGLAFLSLTETLVQKFKNAGEEKFSLLYPHF